MKMILAILTLLSFIVPFLIHLVFRVSDKKGEWVTALYPLAIFYFRSWTIIIESLLITVFIYFTVPVVHI